MAETNRCNCEGAIRLTLNEEGELVHANCGGTVKHLLNSKEDDNG